MSNNCRIYEAVKGLAVDCYLYDCDEQAVLVSNIVVCNFVVRLPNGSEETWDVSKVAPNILRHIVPDDSILEPGKYSVQPYIETVGGFKGRWGTVFFYLRRNMQ